MALAIVAYYLAFRNRRETGDRRPKTEDGRQKTTGDRRQATGNRLPIAIGKATAGRKQEYSKGYKK